MSPGAQRLLKPGLAVAGLGLFVFATTRVWKAGDPVIPPVPQSASSRIEPAARSLVTFERGKYYTPTVANSAARTFAEATEDDRRKAASLVGMLSDGSSLDDVQKLLMEARDIESDAVLPVVNKLLKHTNPDARTLGLTLIEGVDSPALVPAVVQALQDPSPDVRIEAMEVAQQITDASLGEIMLKALDDDNLSVRQLALQSAGRLGDDVRSRAIEKAAGSPRPDLASAAVALLEAEPSKRTVGLVFKALDHPSVSVREQAHEMLFLTMHQSFNSAAHAQSWWQQNQDAFNNDLLITDPERFIKR